MTEKETTTDGPEVRRVREVAEEYERRGYDVTIGPGPEEVPQFLSQYRPDLIARRHGEGGEAVVIEVKRRRSLPRTPHLRGLARTIEDRPGWRYELVLTNPAPVDAPSGFERESPFGKREAANAIAEAEELARSAHPEAALLLAWSAAEGALRLLASAEGVSLKRSDPPYLLKQLAVEGAISREDYELLTQAARSRNAIAHGFSARGDRDNLAHLVGALRETTDRLLDSLPDAQPA